MSLLDYSSFHLVGIKGVAMTALAQCLLDAGKTVTGSDVAEDFVTAEILSRLPISLQVGFQEAIPSATDCVIYTAAHNGKLNPQVQAALNTGIPLLSQAEAVSELFNAKQGVAVCGVGGKSTVSAMISWVMEKAGLEPSFTVGVGNIPELNKTGQWRAHSPHFVCEADEYVTNPTEAKQGAQIIPRFSYLNPFITVCTNLAFDHPDVYRDFDHTKATFLQFFKQIKPNGALIINGDSAELTQLAQQSGKPVITFGEQPTNDYVLTGCQSQQGQTTAVCHHQGETFTLTLSIPGKFNIMNALAALVVTDTLGIPRDEALKHLTQFKSTMRRFENRGEFQGARLYDDYAHHPNEVKQALTALAEWYPEERKIIAFQPHTFSRTKSLFSEFVDAFAQADEVVLLDIFASARESFDTTVSSAQLAKEIQNRYPAVKTKLFSNTTEFAQYCRQELKPNTVLLTVGAGDIYQVYDQLRT